MSQLKILVPLDRSKQAEHALAFLTALKPLGDIELRLLTVVETDDFVSPEMEARQERRATEYLDELTDRLSGLQIPIDCVYRTGKPYAEILAEAERDDVNLVLMTTHGQTIVQPERLGSVIDKVMRGTRAPLLVVGPNAAVPLQVELITVPLDGSSLAAESLPVARSLAERLGSGLRLVRAVQAQPVDEDMVGSFAADLVESIERTATLYLSEVKLELETVAPVETAVLNGPPTEALLTDVHEHRPAFLVMTSHGHTGFIRWALGSVTDRLVRGPVPVLVLKPSSESLARLEPLTQRGT